MFFSLSFCHRFDAPPFDLSPLAQLDLTRHQPADPGLTTSSLSHDPGPALPIPLPALPPLCRPDRSGTWPSSKASWHLRRPHVFFNVPHSEPATNNTNVHPSPLCLTLRHPMAWRRSHLLRLPLSIIDPRHLSTRLPHRPLRPSLPPRHRRQP